MLPRTQLKLRKGDRPCCNVRRPARFSVWRSAPWSAAPRRRRRDFPSRPITLVVPFPAGGTADLLCRYAGEKASAELGQQVVIENRPGGAGGRVGIEQVLRAPPDGYTLLCSTQLSYSITHLVFAKASFDPRPLEPISVLATYPLVILTRARPAGEQPRGVQRLRQGPARSTTATRASPTPAICSAR